MTSGRKQPRPVPDDQVRPDPPPAPPRKRKRRATVVARVSYSHCEIYCSGPMRCPLCGIDVPPYTAHTCSKKEPR